MPKRNPKRPKTLGSWEKGTSGNPNGRSKLARAEAMAMATPILANAPFCVAVHDHISRTGATRARRQHNKRAIQKWLKQPGLQSPLARLKVGKYVAMHRQMDAMYVEWCKQIDAAAPPEDRAWPSA